MTDYCRSCDHFWLDAGELAKIQVIFRFSPQGEEAFRLQDRLNNMKESDKEELDEMISRLKGQSLFGDIANYYESRWI